MVKGKLTDLEFMKSVNADVDRLYTLNIRMQRLFREWSELERPRSEHPSGITRPSQAMIEGFIGLVQDYSDDELRETIARQVKTAEAMAVAFFHRAAALLSEPPDPARAVNPYAVSLRPDAWDADGLYDEPGLTRADALGMAGGIENFWLGDPAVAP
jgi:hypothetical protein